MPSKRKPFRNLSVFVEFKYKTLSVSQGKPFDFHYLHYPCVWHKVSNRREAGIKSPKGHGVDVFTPQMFTLSPTLS